MKIQHNPYTHPHPHLHILILSSIMNPYNILGLFHQKHNPEIIKEEHDPILPRNPLVVERKDIPKRIECELIAGICMSLMGDNIEKIVDILNTHFGKNVKVLPLIETDEQYEEQKHTFKNYKDGVLYPKGYTSDSVHWYYENADGRFDGYTQMKQLDGGHQFCQGHAIAFAYYPEYRYTYEEVKEKEWFVNNDLLGAYEEAYTDILLIFKEILPIVLKSISKSLLIKLINDLLTEQFADEYDGGEDPRYFKIIQKKILKFVKLVIKNPKLIISKKTNYIPQIKHKRTYETFEEDESMEITNFILDKLSQQWAIKYMSGGYYDDYDKVDMNLLEEDSEDEQSDSGDEQSESEDEL